MKPEDITRSVISFLTVILFIPLCPAEENNSPEDVIAEYSENVSRLEKEFGPYNWQLSEPLLAMGMELKNKGAYDEAADVFHRVLHVKRVNEGLYSTNQLPVIELALNNHELNNNWEGVNQYHNYRYWIYKRNFEPDDPRLIPVMRRLSGWHLAASNLEAGESSARHLLKYVDLNERALDLMEQANISGAQEMAEQMYRVAMSYYYLAVVTQVSGLTGKAVVDKLEPLKSRTSYSLAMEQLVDRHYRKGMAILLRLLENFENHPDINQETRSMALTYIADWNLLFNKEKSAFKSYRKAYLDLLNYGVEQKQAKQYFESPVILPRKRFAMNFASDLKQNENRINTVPLNDRKPDENMLEFVAWSDNLPGISFPEQYLSSTSTPTGSRYAVASFDVEKNGWTEKIKINEYYPEKRRTRREAKEGVWAVQFRPQLDEGQAIRTADFAMRYVLPE